MGGGGQREGPGGRRGHIEVEEGVLMGGLSQGGKWDQTGQLRPNMVQAC